MLRRVALALIRRTRRWLFPPLPPGSVRRAAGSTGDGLGVYTREFTAEEQAELRAAPPRGQRPAPRWLDRGPRPRW